MFVTFVGLTTQVVRSTIWSISRPNYLKKGSKLYLVTPAAWHDFCKITQWRAPAVRIHLSRTTELVKQQRKQMAALCQIAFDGKGFRNSKMHSP